MKDPDGIVKMITIDMNVSATILLLGKLKTQDKRKTSELMRLNDSLTYAVTTDKLTGAMNRHVLWGKEQAIFEDVISKSGISAFH